MNVLAQIVVWLNEAANALTSRLFAPIGYLPGWLSLTIIATITGIVMLVIFKHTSNQGAIKATRNDIKANIYALKLFKDNVGVTIRSQGRIFLGVVRSLFLSLVPMLVMALPITMLWSQLALWYQARPLRVGEEAVMTLKLNGPTESPWPKVDLQPTKAVEVTVGPVHVRSQRELCWNIRALTAGEHRLEFQVDGKPIDKELAIGDGFAKVSLLRPGWSWWDALVNPEEQPFNPQSPVQSIDIVYPKRSSWTYGSNTWVFYWFIVSMVVAFFCGKLLGVNF